MECPESLAQNCEIVRKMQQLSEQSRTDAARSKTLYLLNGLTIWGAPNYPSEASWWQSGVHLRSGGKIKQEQGTGRYRKEQESNSG